MRGYLATVIGGMALIVLAYFGLGRLLVSLTEGWADCSWTPTACPSREARFLVQLLIHAALPVAALAGALGAAISVRLTRSVAALETGVAVLVVWFVAFGALTMINVLGPPVVDQVVGSLLVGPPVVALVAGSFLLARWLGLRWHVRRSAAWR